MKELVVKRILYFCKIKKMTIKDLANNCHLDEKKLNNLLFGKAKRIKIDTLNLLCKGLNISLVEFFDSDIFLKNQK